MKKYIVSAKAGAVLATLMVFFSAPVPTQTMSVAPDPFQSQSYRKAFFDAARIYGKAGCGDMNLAEMTAAHSLQSGVPANVVAAIVAVESSCNPLAISAKGDVGLTQINVKVQASAYDFSKVNLLNPEESLRVGTEIMASKMRAYGPNPRAWVSHYNGVGPGADAYALKVLALADTGGK